MRAGLNSFRKLIPIFLAAAICAHGETYCLTIAGLGGEPEYEQRFASWAQELDKILKSGGAEMKVESLYGPAATRVKVRSVLESFAREAKPRDAVLVILIGHGSFDGTDYKINLPGPDVSATELASLLDRIPASRQLVINTTSASGGSVHALQKPNRLVMTATRSGSEKNATIFARFFVESLRDSTADTDKNETITALEAFKYADEKTKLFYTTLKRLATEHASLDDGNAQSQVAAGRFPLLRLGETQLAAKDPAKQALLAKREELEQQIDELKLQKAAMGAEEYRKQITELLLQLSRTQAELDKPGPAPLKPGEVKPGDAKPVVNPGTANSETNLN
jgi:hypothetical protein